MKAITLRKETTVVAQEIEEKVQMKYCKRNQIWMDIQPILRTFISQLIK